MRVRREWLLSAIGATLVLLHHAAWYRAFPQYSAYPPDQAGYLAGGRAIFAGTASLFRDGLRPATIEELRRWFDFFGVGLLYGAIDALKPGDLGVVRAVFAVFNALTVAGVISLARRLSSARGALIAAALFIVSPAFPSGASRLYADPVTGCLIVWGVRLFVDGERLALLGGALCGAAMLIRVQMLPWVPLGLALCTAAALMMKVDARARALIGRGWLGLGAPLLLFAGLTYFGLENRNDSAPKHNLPRYHYYAYGFWQYLDSDGWEGPWRLKKDPFYAALVEESRVDEGLLSSRPRQYLFALRYVSTRLDRAIPIVLGNFYRIFDRPQNPEHRGFIPPSAATAIHRAALLLALVGAVSLYASGSAGLVAPLLVLCLGAFHALAWGWPRYAMPVLPLILAVAGVGFDALAASLSPSRRAWLRAMGSLALIAAATVVRDSFPEAGRLAGMVGLVAGLAAVVIVPFAAGPAGARFASRLLAGGLTLVVFGNGIRDRAWHQRGIALRDGDVIQQRIAIPAESLSALRASREPVLGLDLELRDPLGKPWPVRVNGLDAVLEPSIPPLPESIPVATEGRAYPQWWTTPLTEAMLDQAAKTGAFSVEVLVSDASVAALKADRFSSQQSVFEAPSLGDWPYAAGIKPEYDRDFRLVRTMPLSSDGAQTTLIREGARSLLNAVARIRVFELEDREGSLAFEAAPVPGEVARKGSRVVVGFAGRAVMRNRGPASISVNGTRLVDFDIAPFRRSVWSNGDFRLCYLDRTPDRSQSYESRGLYLLSGPLPCVSSACRVDVRFWPGRDDRPMSFQVETPKSQPAVDVIRAAAADCGFEDAVVAPFARLLDGTKNNYPEDRGRWKVARVY